MKNMLIATDFSDRASNAAHYGYCLARVIKADIILFNVFKVPAKIPHSSHLAWPMEDYTSLNSDSFENLQRLVVKLKGSTKAFGFDPSIRCISETGTIVDVVEDINYQVSIDLIVIGTHGSTGLNTLLLGNNCRLMIEGMYRPLLIIPPEAKFRAVKRIAFATDFKFPKEDIVSFHRLVSLAVLLEAEILIVYIYNENDYSAEFTDWVDRSLIGLSHKSYYSHIKHTSILNSETKNGLDSLCENGQIDILSMVHRPHNFIQSLITGSDTQRMADHISIPLLVFKGKMPY